MGRFMWQHLSKNEASLWTSLTLDDSKYLTATGVDLNFFKHTVPNLPLLRLSSGPRSSSIVGWICKSSLEVLFFILFLAHPWNTHLVVFSFSFSFLKLSTSRSTFLSFSFLLLLLHADSDFSVLDHSSAIQVPFLTFVFLPFSFCCEQAFVFS